MWICLSEGFVSIVAHRDDPTCLLVRARKAGHLEALLGRGAEVVETRDADYRYRASCSRQQVAEAVARQVEGISYDNFKDSVQDDLLHRLYMRVWDTMLELQGRVGRYARPRISHPGDRS